MCSICGYFSRTKPIAVAEFEHANRLLSHRGPDHAGTASFDLNGLRSPSHATSTHAWIGHNRLSIVDLSDQANQPFHSKCGRYVMVFNGEIYNFLELKSELSGLGFEFTTTSDSEVLLNAYLAWGKRCVERFNGMWAFAIVDSVKGTIFASRDRFGKKPFFYHFDSPSHTFIFASEMKFIRRFVSTTQNERSVRKYLLYGENQNTPESFYQEIKILGPGHVLEYGLKDNQLSVERFWDLRPKAVDHSLESIESLLHDSVRLRLRNDIPVLGASLSGGMDSSMIVSLLDETIRQDRIPKRLHTFTAYFPGLENRELDYAKEVMNRIDGDHHLITPKYDDMIREFEMMMEHQEQPVLSIAIFVHWLIMKEVSKHNIRVYFSGHGGDELFGGYYEHFINLIIDDLVRCNPAFVKRLAQFNRIRPGFNRIIRSLLRTLISNSRLVDGLKATAGALGVKSHSFRPFFNFIEEKTKYPNPFPGEWLKYKVYTEIKSHPLHEWLQYEDRNAMAFAIESRVPFLDYRLVEATVNLSNDFKFGDDRFKYLLRRLGEGRLPQSLLNRTDKYGFTSHDFYNNNQFRSFVMDHVMSSELRSTGLVNRKRLEHFLKERDRIDDPFVWRIFNLAFWLRMQPPKGNAG